MLLLKTLIFVVLLVGLVFVGLRNNAPVSLDLVAWQLTDVPLYLSLFGAALFGLLIGLAFAGVREIQWRMELARQRRQSADAERELHGLRTASLEAPASEDSDGPVR
jgi:uncharacterized integral membrane protein